MRFLIDKIDGYFNLRTLTEFFRTASNGCYMINIIEHAELGRLVFVTDTMMLEYKLPAGVNHLMLEANYSDSVLDGNIMDGVTPAATKDRLLRSHMELGTTLGILRANDITDVKEVVLVHLSARNADPERFCDAVRRVTGKPTYAAHKGLVIEMTK